MQESCSIPLSKGNKFGFELCYNVLRLNINGERQKLKYGASSILYFLKRLHLSKWMVCQWNPKSSTWDTLIPFLCCIIYTKSYCRCFDFHVFAYSHCCVFDSFILSLLCFFALLHFWIFIFVHVYWDYT